MCLSLCFLQIIHGTFCSLISVCLLLPPLSTSTANTLLYIPSFTTTHTHTCLQTHKATPLDRYLVQTYKQAHVHTHVNVHRQVHSVLSNFERVVSCFVLVRAERQTAAHTNLSLSLLPFLKSVSPLSPLLLTPKLPLFLSLLSLEADESSACL